MPRAKLVAHWAILLAIACASRLAGADPIITIGAQRDDGLVPIRVRVDLAADEAVLPSYRTGKRSLELTMCRTRAKGRDDAPREVEWLVPAAAAQLPAKLGRCATVASLDDVSLLVLFADGRAEMPARAVVPWGDRWLIVRAGAKSISEIELMPELVERSAIREVRIERDACWAWSGDGGLAAAVARLGPPPAKGLAKVVTIPFPGLAQDVAYACGLNAFKCLLTHAGRGLTLDEIATRIGYRLEDFKRHGLPWEHFHRPDGKLYTGLGITDHLLLRADVAPDNERIDAWNSAPSRSGAALADRLVRIPRGHSEDETMRKRQRMNWSAHAMLKLLLATGHPAVIDLYATGMSHLITVWGYDSDKKAYVVNEGADDEMTLMSARALDERWANFGYDTIALGFPPLAAEVAVEPEAPAPVRR
ncbi:MAG TPA: hypothetical protein VEL07_23370 [Planctomycetota bacterium]|nr:hypothetical protein [Planctomycetota bacterium]